MLKNPHIPSFSFAHIGLAFVGLMWVLPFLYYNHAYPITTFYQEWGAALLGLCALPLLVTGRYWQQPNIPRVVLLPVSFLMLLFLQFLFHRIENFDQLLLLALYLLWAALLIMLGQRLRVELGMAMVATWLAVFLLVGAELQTLVGILQHYRWHTFLDSVVTVKVSSSVYGNIAQPNHFANYLALALASLGLLFVLGKLRAWQTVLLAVPMLFVLVLSGSRSSWFYLMWMAASAYLWQRRDPANRLLLRYALAVLIGFGLMHLVVQIPWLEGASSTSTVERMFGSDATGSIRLALWRESWFIFNQFPLLGAGFGQFAWQNFNLDIAQHDLIINGLYNNAHNIVIQTAAETGLVGVGCLLGTLLLWVWPQRMQPRSLYHWWGYAVLMVLAIHSLLEYPLWYGYFIGIAAIMLGLFDFTVFKLELRNLGRLSVATMLLLGAVSLYQSILGYGKLEAALKLRASATNDSSYTSRLRKALIDAHAYPLVSSYAELFLTGMIEPSVDHLKEKMVLNERAMHFVPIAPVVYREVWLLQLAGRTEEAKTQLAKAIWMWPGDFVSTRADLSNLARKDPERFGSLLEFASQKNEEYLRAVRTK